MNLLARALMAEDSIGFVCDPNNPTGRAAEWPQLVDAICGSRSEQLRLIVDQSFAPFAGSDLPPEILDSGRALVVRSLTKRLGTPGIRVGYVIGPPRLLAEMRALRDPWSVGAHALAAARATSWRLPQNELEVLTRWRRELSEALARRGLSPVPSSANFVMAHAGPVASALLAAAARSRIAVRSCSSFGLPAYVRLAVRPPREQRRLLGAFDTALKVNRR
jgi:histidinol-phosphate/aromatic aminotransferase/cobyric acid decarboxylase-like protein